MTSRESPDHRSRRSRVVTPAGRAENNEPTKARLTVNLRETGQFGILRGTAGRCAHAGRDAPAGCAIGHRALGPAKAPLAACGSTAPESA